MHQPDLLLPWFHLFTRNAVIRRLAGCAETRATAARGCWRDCFSRRIEAQSFVLIDGMRVEFAGLGAAQLSQRRLDHMDVVNGDVLALYGSNVLGGVVQVFTRHGGDHAQRAGLQRSVLSVQRQSVDPARALPLPGAVRLSITSTISSTRTISLRTRTTRRVAVPATRPAGSRSER